MAELPAAEEELTPAALERGRLLFAGPCEFFAGAMTLAQLPPARGPEVAFAGRSNVGKSSLVNALTGRKALARVSNTPGRTQQLNFFDLGQGRLSLVDLPGYGYSSVGKAKAEAWTETTRAYLKGRPELRRVCLLVDSRHGLKPGDEDIMKLLDQSAVVYQVVLTKADKTSKADLAKVEAATAAVLKRHVAAHPVIRVTSSEEGVGIPELRAELAALAA
ncbi:MAG TPA: ribosome biogenesis GTP-binding protein YihA/YsxC [Ferrovibrio sp.]|uniref:ribosome biogenesis GTP-binding protein YihA/YsxC n=1 Tax=Ferrovibrio sp. TaxID=1917215 RepID=UPI002B4ACE16|nr:ribosome biogenesis GTP-binding protein YihA/YsxC [Ferrovibrio sp.]HLT77127.1 ribosome biogenesis GTP-binding protein YihA/YsxC [Ferrovibrio sp.]